jgi:mannan endo-1,4-beta-mannosidase
MAVKFGGYFPPFPFRAKRDHLEATEQRLGRHIDAVMWYQWWDTPWLLGKKPKEFQTSWIAEAGNRDILIKWEPWKPGKQIVQPEFSLQSIVAGRHDLYIRRWAQKIRDCRRQIYLSPMPEMNGFWNQWSIPLGKHKPEDFHSAWRYLHQVFASEGAGNVSWVWAPNAGDMPLEIPMELFFPGGEYVDVLGLSVYNWGTVRHWSKWNSFAEIIQPYYDRISLLSDSPIWIAEMGCAPEGGDKSRWIQEMFQYLPSLPRLETIIWFDMKKETDWRISELPVSERRSQSDTRVDARGT